MLAPQILLHFAATGLRLLFVLYQFWGLRQLGRLLGLLWPAPAGAKAPRLLIDIALGFAVLSTALRLLAAAGWATPRGVLLLYLLPPLTLLKRFPVAPYRPNWRSWGSRPMLLLLAAIALAPLPLALCPAFSVDAMAYHLRFPELTLQTGHWMTDRFNSPSFFPAATGALYLPGLAADSAGILAQLTHYGFFLLSLRALHLLGEKSGPPGGGLLAALLFASLPVVLVIGGMAWSDLPLCFALLCAALALGEGWLAPALVCLGLAAAVKYTGLLVGAPLGAVLLARGLGLRDWRALLTGGVAGAATAAPWYLSNWLATGNPVYPLLERLFGRADVSGQQLLHWSGPSSPAQWMNYFLHPATYDSDLGGAAMLALFALCVIAGLLHASSRVMTAVALCAFAAVLPFAPAARVFMPAIAGLCLVTGVALARLRSLGGSFRWITLPLLLLVACNAALGIAGCILTNPLLCALGVETESDNWLRNFEWARLYAGADTLLPADARVLMIGDGRAFRFPRPTTAGSMVDPPAILAYLGGPPDAVIARLRADRITHLLVAPQSRAAWTTRDHALSLSPGDKSRLEDVLKLCPLISRGPGVELRALPPPAARSAP